MSAKKQASRFPKRSLRSKKENFSPTFFCKIFPPSVAALTTDVSVDFALAHSTPLLTAYQQAYLKRHTQLSVKKVFNIKQIHGRRVILATSLKYRNQKRIPLADAVIARDVHVPIAVRTADCLPIFVYDPRQHAIAVIHAGWRSTQKRIAAATLSLMKKRFGTRVQDVRVALGPALRSCCYEVGKEFIHYFPQDVVRRQGKLFFDLVAANKRQLTTLGVKPSHLRDSRACTVCQRGFASYRKDGEKATRMLSLMVLKAEK